MTKKSQSKKSVEDERDNALIQAHLVEYQALTNRVSYWIVLQISLLPVVPVYVVLGYQAWQSGAIRTKELAVWVTFALLQLVAMLRAHALLELYSVVKYIECYLRPPMRKELHTDSFWSYEPYLVKHRAINTAWGSFSLPFLGSLVFVVLLLVRLHEFSWWDAGGLFINLALLVALWNFSYKAKEIKRDWSECDKLLAQRLKD